MSSYKLVFLRHGESVGNVEGFIQGQSDFPLTERGVVQVRKLIQRWQVDKTCFDAIISSPLQRARQTAMMIGDAFNVPVEYDNEWQERDAGKLTGMKFSDAVESPLFLDFYTPFHSMGETGEGNWELFLRAGKALAKILKRPPGRYLVVSHGGILNQAVRALVGIMPQANSQGAKFHLVNAAFATIYYDPETYKWTVFGLNDFTHLGIKSSELEAEEDE